MKIGIVGYGKMGTGIFRLLAAKDFEVVVYIRDPDKCRAAEGKYFKSLARAVKRGRITGPEFEEKQRAIRFSSRYDDFSECDLVLETAVEDYEAKLAIFRRLESIVRPNATLATNTSSISVSLLARQLAHPERFCGLHFFYPVLLIDLVEIIQADATDPQIIDSLRNLCGLIGKKCITVRDAPGSVLNAILAFYYIESLYILEEGRWSPSRVDELAKRFFYVGPCESMDIIGIDFLVDALKRSAAEGTLCPIYWELGPDGGLPREHGVHDGGFYAPALLQRLLDAGRLGRKTSRGIYLYEKEKPMDDEGGFYHSPAAPYLAPGQQTEDVVAMRLQHAVFNGSLRCLAQQMASADDIDLGVREILQMREGPFTTMKSLGRDELQARFDGLARDVGDRYRQDQLAVLWD